MTIVYNVFTGILMLLFTRFPATFPALTKPLEAFLFITNSLPAQRIMRIDANECTRRPLINEQRLTRLRIDEIA